MRFSSVRPDLSPEDEEVKRRLVRCHPRAYSELIRLDIPGQSGAKPARLPALRSSPPVSKSSLSSALEPLIVNPIWGEHRARLEVLEKKKMSVKRKIPASPEGCPPARGKILKVGVSSSPSSTVGARDPSRRAAEPPWRFFLFWSRVLCRKAPIPLLQCQIMWEGVALVLRGMMTLSFLMWSLPLGLFL